MTQDLVVKAHCNPCANNTRHHVLHRVNRTFPLQDEEGTEYGYERVVYELLECAGCEGIKLRAAWSSNQYPSYVTYYPAAELRREPTWLSEFLLESILNPYFDTLHSLLREVYKALRNEMPRVAAMGIRAIFEAIMVEEVGDKGTFKANLKAFVDAGHLAEKHRPHVESVLDAGSAAIHRGYSPPIADVSAMLDLAEGLIASTYIHGPAVTRVAQRVPPRPPRA